MTVGAAIAKSSFEAAQDQGYGGTEDDFYLALALTGDNGGPGGSSTPTDLPTFRAEITDGSVTTSGRLPFINKEFSSDDSVIDLAAGGTSNDTIRLKEAGVYLVVYEFEFQSPQTGSMQTLTATLELDGVEIDGSRATATCFFDSSLPGSNFPGRICQAFPFSVSAATDLNIRADKTVIGGNTGDITMLDGGKLSVIKLQGTKGDKGDKGDPGTGSTISVRQGGGTLIPGVSEIQAGSNVSFTDNGSGVVTLNSSSFHKAFAEITPAAPQGTRSSTFQQALRLATTLPTEAFHTGQYLLDWRILWSYNVGTSDAEIRVQQNDSVTLWTQREEPKDAAGTGVNYTRIETGGTETSGTNQRISGAGASIISLTAGQTYNFDLDIRAEDNNSAAVIYRAIMLLRRW